MNGHILRLSGTPYEQGRQQGIAVADAITRNYRQIQALIDRLSTGRAEWYRGLVNRNRDYLARVDPDTIEELAGIADGSGLAVDSLHAMNMPVYMLLRRAKVVEECSIYAAGPGATSDGRTYLVKTRDQPLDQFQFEHVVLARNYPSGHTINEVNAAGIITNPGSGVNGSGLAVGTAGSWSRERMRVRVDALSEAHAMPDMHYLLRHATSVDEACHVLRETPRLAGMNILVADRSGRIATIEVTTDAAVCTPAERGFGLLTNHYVHPTLAMANDPREQNLASFERYDIIRNFLEGQHGTLGPLSLLGLAMDHSRGPQSSVCRHPDDGRGSVTRYVSLVSIDELETWTYCDNPCGMALVTRLTEAERPATTDNEEEPVSR